MGSEHGDKREIAIPLVAFESDAELNFLLAADSPGADQKQKCIGLIYADNDIFFKENRTIGGRGKDELVLWLKHE